MYTSTIGLMTGQQLSEPSNPQDYSRECLSCQQGTSVLALCTLCGGLVSGLLQTATKEGGFGCLSNPWAWLTKCCKGLPLPKPLAASRSSDFAA